MCACWSLVSSVRSLFCIEVRTADSDPNQCGEVPAPDTTGSPAQVNIAGAHWANDPPSPSPCLPSGAAPALISRSPARVAPRSTTDTPGWNCSTSMSETVEPHTVSGSRPSKNRRRSNSKPPIISARAARRSVTARSTSTGADQVAEHGVIEPGMFSTTASRSTRSR